MNLHPKAIDMLISFREEIKLWRQDDAGNGHSYIRRTAPIELPDRNSPQPPPETTEDRFEVVKSEMATDFIMLESLSYALRKHGVAE